MGKIFCTVSSKQFLLIGMPRLHISIIHSRCSCSTCSDKTVDGLGFDSTLYRMCLRLISVVRGTPHTFDAFFVLIPCTSNITQSVSGLFRSVLLSVESFSHACTTWIKLFNFMTVIGIALVSFLSSSSITTLCLDYILFRTVRWTNVTIEPLRCLDNDELRPKGVEYDELWCPRIFDDVCSLLKQLTHHFWRPKEMTRHFWLHKTLTHHFWRPSEMGLYFWQPKSFNDGLLMTLMGFLRH